nr:hypothetical protein [Candidatus Korarchaeota archaeon]
KVELDKQRVQIEALKTMADIEKTNAEAKNENADAFVKISELMDDMEGRLSDVYETIEVLLSSKESEKATGEPESPEIETVAEEPKSSE